MIYKNESYEKERSLYNIKDSQVINCTFEGKEDGESPLKECKNILVKDSLLNLRYPFCFRSRGLFQHLLQPRDPGCRSRSDSGSHSLSYTCI